MRLPSGYKVEIYCDTYFTWVAVRLEGGVDDQTLDRCPLCGLQDCLKNQETTQQNQGVK